MSRRNKSRRLGNRLRRLVSIMFGARESCHVPPIFEPEALEPRMLLSLTPSIYAVTSAPVSSPSVTVYLRATGTQASQITSVTLNMGDGSSPTSIPVPAGSTYPFPLITYNYASHPGNYVIAATAYINSTGYTTGGLSLDPAFGAPATNNQPISQGINTTSITGNDAAYGVAIDTSGTVSTNSNHGKIYVADAAGSNFAVTRYNTNGTLDTTFNSLGTGGAPPGTAYAGISGKALAVTVDSGGRIVAAGQSNGNFTVVRFLSSGSLDTTFGSSGIVTTSFSGSSQATALAIQPDGYIVAVGTANLTGTPVYAAARYNPSGTPDSNFGVSGQRTVTFPSTVRTTPRRSRFSRRARDSTWCWAAMRPTPRAAGAAASRTTPPATSP